MLPEPYQAEKGRLIVREMTDQLALELVRKRLVCDQLVLHIGYDHTGIPSDYSGTLTRNYYGKTVPKPAHGSANLGWHTASARQLIAAAMQLYSQITDPALLVRRINIIANHVIAENALPADDPPVQYSLFDDPAVLERRHEQERLRSEKERKLQEALLNLKSRYGKNAVLRGMNFKEGATAIMRNGQVGGHRA